MSKVKYISPLFLEANGTISLTTSQLAELGIGDVAEWEDYWSENGDIINGNFPDFNINDSSTYPAGFVAGDNTTWDVLIGF